MHAPLPVPIIQNYRNQECEAPPSAAPAIPEANDSSALHPDDLAGAYAANTVAAYDGDWRHWCRWCAATGKTPLPASAGDVADYIRWCGDRYTVATIKRRLVTIAQAHRLKNAPFDGKAPAIHLAVRALVRRKGTKAENARRPLSTEEVVQLLGEVPKDTARGIRDRAIILITYAGALRRSETVSIDWEHIDWKQKGIIITLGRTKADQEGKGEPVPIVYGDNPATCPVRALKAWQKRAGVDVGPVFRSIPRRIPDSYAGDIWQHLGPRLSDRHLYDAVKEYGAAAKLDVSRLGGHSFRAGHITEAFEREASIADVQKQARHADVRNTMRYNRGSDLLRHSSSAKLGL